jgi:hypothetical protein
MQQIGSAAMTSHWLFFSIAVIHFMRRSKAAIDPKGLETLASTSAVSHLPAVQSRRFTGKSRPLDWDEQSGI